MPLNSMLMRLDFIVPFLLPFHSCASSSHETDVASEPYRNSCFSDSSLEIDLESGVTEIKVNLAKVVEKDCRICHLGLQSAAYESGVAIELGCSCKGDLASAHKLCAEKWFKIKGNKMRYKHLMEFNVFLDAAKRSMNLLEQDQIHDYLCMPVRSLIQRNLLSVIRSISTVNSSSPVAFNQI